MAHMVVYWSDRKAWIRESKAAQIIDHKLFPLPHFRHYPHQTDLWAQAPWGQYDRFWVPLGRHRMILGKETHAAHLGGLEWLAWRARRQKIAGVGLLAAGKIPRYPSRRGPICSGPHTNDSGRFFLFYI